ncbi:MULTISPECIES: hypothetical protein [unclassified Cryobacterium]|nr:MULTISPECIES: hypothetical protein [unclassified Cryobacterium]MEB0264768.1 hypothetical protein [Cryobacterium sp. 10I5]MEB0273740.1 hypothetical protein [Cryobacterium sp. 5B3]
MSRRSTFILRSTHPVENLLAAVAAVAAVKTISDESDDELEQCS